MSAHPIQLFDSESSTYTYILPAPESREAVIIDPVDTHWARDLAQVERLGLQLVYVLETHAHADHVTSAGKLREMTNAKAAVPSGCEISFADMQLVDGDTICFGGQEEIRVMHTPGHTAGSMSCSSTAAAGPISRAEALTTSTKVLPASCSPCRRRPWFGPRMTTTDSRYPPSPGKRQITPGWQEGPNRSL